MPAPDEAASGFESGTDAALSDETIRHVLTEGTIEVTGRLTDASNLTLLACASADGVDVECVYKPIRGERPLWDFPDGTLAHREVAARRIAEYAGWDCVPLTILRDGPYGSGMVQRWVDEPAGAPQLVDLVPLSGVTPGWLTVFRAVDVGGMEVAVVHADAPQLAVLAGFDMVVNNADRKGSHVLSAGNDRVLGVDHGLCFHTDDKLRTILWGFAGKELPEPVSEGLARLASGLSGELADEMDELLTRAEVKALRARVSRLRTTGVFRDPPRTRTAIPWPPL